VPNNKHRRYVRALSKEILQTVPRKTERQMTIPGLSFYFDNISRMLLAVKLYTRLNEGIKNVVIFSDYLII
jgi:hypothetical protein